MQFESKKSYCFSSVSAQEIATLHESLGFDLRLISSQNYTMDKLGPLRNDQIWLLRDTFAHNANPTLREALGTFKRKRRPNAIDYKEALKTADTEKLTRLIKCVGVLLQAKAYLFSSKDETHKQ